MDKEEENELISQIRFIELELEPERLTWDGERSQKDIRVAYKRLTKEHAKLIKQLGRIPTHEELFPELALRAERIKAGNHRSPFGPGA